MFIVQLQLFFFVVFLLFFLFFFLLLLLLLIKCWWRPSSTIQFIMIDWCCTPFSCHQKSNSHDLITIPHLEICPPLWVMHFAPLLIPTLSAQPPLPTSWRRATLEPLHPFGMFNHPTFTRTWPSTCWGIKPNFTSWPSKDIRNHPHGVGWNPHTKAAQRFFCFFFVFWNRWHPQSQAESFHPKLQINSKSTGTHHPTLKPNF